MEKEFNQNINRIKLKQNLNINLNPIRISLKKPIPLFILPPIDNETKRQALIQPTSILTKFVHDKTRNLINHSKQELQRPIKIKLDKIQNLKRRNISHKKNDFTNNIFITNNENLKEFNSKIEETNFNNKNSNLDLNNISNLNKRKLNINDIDNISSLTIDHKIKESQINSLIHKFRRTRIYQPIISENWKFRNGLRITIGNQKGNSYFLKDDVDYQYKVINDEFKLLEDNYTYYKSTVTLKEDYLQSFTSLPLTSKINYNKSLEETIGILDILPQLLLLEFYKLIKTYSSVTIPDPDLFKEKYVFDEVKNLKYNNALLVKVYDFFKSCYEVYGTLIKEVNEMCLKENEFRKVINCLEKARYNLNYVTTSSENALKNYNNDLKSIEKIINDKSISKSIDLSIKMRNQFGFKKNKEKQRRIRIESALENKYDKDDYNEEYRKKYSQKKIFNSFVESKLINGLMNHLTKEAKNDITTHRINKEINGNYNDEEEIRKKHEVIRINL